MIEPPDRPTRRGTDHVTQHVEVWQDGAWRTALLIGCRLHADGSAQAHLRCTINGERHNMWRPFDQLRLPPGGGSPREAGPEHPGRHRADRTVVAVHAGQARHADQLTTRLPLSRVSVPPPGGSRSHPARLKR